MENPLIKKGKLAARIIFLVAFFLPTTTFALAWHQPNTVYMMGASMDAQLYNDPALTPAINYYGISPTEIANGGKFWGNLPNPNSFYLKYTPLPASTAKSMITTYKNETGGFTPIIPGYITVGFVASICQSDPDGSAPQKSEIEDLKDRISAFITNDVYPSTTVVLMKYPVENVACTPQMVQYNSWVDYIKMLHTNVVVINPWDGVTYTTNDSYHANRKEVLIKAQRTLRIASTAGLTLRYVNNAYRRTERCQMIFL